jgi:hypothetical protein
VTSLRAWLQKTLNLCYESDNLRTLITFQDLDLHIDNFFHFITYEITEAMSKRFAKDANTYCPDVYLVTHYGGVEVVQPSDWLSIHISDIQLLILP